MTPLLKLTGVSKAFGAFQALTYTYTPPTKPFLGMGHVFATQQVDLRAEKPLRLGNGQDLSLVVDLFNAFNNANYGCYNTTLQATPNPNYGTPGCAGLGWRLQFGARYNYRANSADDDAERDTVPELREVSPGHAVACLYDVARPRS